MDANFWINILEGNGRYLNEKKEVKGLPKNSKRVADKVYVNDKFVGRVKDGKYIEADKKEKENIETKDNTKKHIDDIEKDPTFKKREDETEEDHKKRKEAEIITRSLADKVGRKKSEKLIDAVKKFEDNKEKDPTILKNLADIFKKNLGKSSMGLLNILDKDLAGAAGATSDAVGSSIDTLKTKGQEKKKKEVEKAKETVEKGKELNKEQLEKEKEKAEVNLEKLEKSLENSEEKDKEKLEKKKKTLGNKIKRIENELKKFQNESTSYKERHMSFKDYLMEKNSTEEAKGALDAVVATLSKNKDLDKEGKEILDMAKGMQDHYKKEKSFSPAQAQWIYKVSKGMFK